MKRVLITGGCGFIGSNLTNYFLKKRIKVFVLDKYNFHNNYGWLEDIKNNNKIEIEMGDIRDYDFVNNAIKKVDSVIHLAALIGIPYSYKSPLAYINTNILGTYNVLESCKQNKIKNIIVTSTSEVYGSSKYEPMDEKHPTESQSPYAASKNSADELAKSYFRSFNLPVKIIRPFNTYGPRQSARAIIPTIISQIASGKKEIKLGDTLPTRDFNYVEDCCRGFIMIAESKNTIGETINIGSNSEISIGELLNLIKKLMSSDVTFINDEKRNRPKKSEVYRLWCDNKKINELVGFKSEVKIQDGLKKTIDWIKKPENLKIYKSEIYNV